VTAAASAPDLPALLRALRHTLALAVAMARRAAASSGGSVFCDVSPAVFGVRLPEATEL
jgi:hypothetical protein